MGLLILAEYTPVGFFASDPPSSISIDFGQPEEEEQQRTILSPSSVLTCSYLCAHSADPLASVVWMLEH